MMATARHPDHEAGAAQGGWRREDHHERAGDRDDTGRHPRPPSPVTGARAIREIADDGSETASHIRDALKIRPMMSGEISSTAVENFITYRPISRYM